MKELWIKKTIYRRYLIEDSETDSVKLWLKDGQETTQGIIDIVENVFDKNECVEYDEEKTIEPIEYDICDLK